MKLKTIDITLIGCGNAVTLTAEDTTTAPIASYALDEFKRKEQMEFVNDGKDYFVPFHAVDHIEVTETSASTPDRPDPYGCDGGSEPTTLWTLTGLYGNGGSLRNGTLPNDNNPNYPVGRYAWGDDGEWVYQGEPTNEVTYGIVEVYKENEEIKSHSVNEFCEVFINDTVNAETHTIEAYLVTCT